MRGINPDGKSITLTPTVPNEKTIIRAIKGYSTFHEVREFGRILGVEFYYHQGHFDRRVPPEWRTFHYNNTWLCENLIQTTSQIRHHAYRQKKYTIGDAANKIRAWSAATARVIKKLSDAYYACLLDKCQQQQFKNEQAFSDSYEDDIFDYIHNVLYYLGTLRDHIAEFIIRCVMIDAPAKLKKEPKMSKLIHFLRKNPPVDYALPADIIDEILAAASCGENGSIVGWIKILSEYRNTITHDRPIQQMRYRLWVWQELKEANGLFYPRIKFPIPSYPFDLKSNPPQNDSDLENYLKEQAPDKKFLHASPDGLEILFELFEKLLVLARKVVDLSPVKATPIVIEPKTYIVSF